MARDRYRPWVALCLARAALADRNDGGGIGAAAIAARLHATLGEAPAWADALARQLARLSGSTWERLDAPALAAHIDTLDAFTAAFAGGARPRIRRLILRPPRLRPLPFALETCARLPVATVGDLADRLGVTVGRLDWLAAMAQDHRPNPQAPLPAPHYRPRWIRKASGGLRLLESPGPELKRVQRQLLADVIRPVPVHETCHGFVGGRSAATHAAVHAGSAWVARFDLQDFFASVAASRVNALWRTLGYPRGVAAALTALCTTRTAAVLLDHGCRIGALDPWTARKLGARHLPQGAPTSPALANLAAFRLDLRLQGLAWAFGARYSRYADDLVFSGDAPLHGRYAALAGWVAAACGAEGFRVQHRKSRCMPVHTRQAVGGLVVNHHPQVARDAFDRLKATLHRCALHGPAAENRDGVADFRAHLRGRVEWASQGSATRARKLHALFSRIDWGDVPAERSG